jgi:uncharacterized protein YjbJ (UPF0337 family)
MNSDELKGKAEKAKGWVKDKTGEIVNNPDLEAEGEVERAKGTVQEGYGKAKRKTQEAMDRVTESDDENTEA